MTLKEQINIDLKTALLSGDRQLATVLRGLKGVILNAEIAQGQRDTGLSDEVICKLLAKEVKSRQESADIYNQNNEPERAQQEMAEKEIIEQYLPKQLSDEELQKLIEQSAKESGVTNMTDMGKLIGSVKVRAGSQADGGRIAQLVKEYLSK